MPRVTRAALRSNNSDSNNEAPRRVFGEITGNSTAQASETPVLIELPLTSENMPPKKSKKGKGGKKAKKAVEDATAQETFPEILEDDNQSTSSDAAEEASEKLRSEESMKETYQIPMADHDRPITPPSPAVREAIKQLSPKTPKFDPEIHVSMYSCDKFKEPEQEKEDSFVDMIASRSPSKHVSPVKEDASKEDSFVKQIVSRSPVKVVTRIEDSVDAIDALEDALEEIGQALPKVQDTESPVKSRKAQPTKGPVIRKQSQSAKGVRKPSQANMKASRQTSTELKHSLATARRNSDGLKRAASKPKPTPELNKLNLKPTTKSLRAGIENAKPNFRKTIHTDALTEPGEAKQNLPKKVHPKPLTKEPFLPAKSTKQPTVSNFELPGEAISRKLKAQREERLKREEEESQKRKEFKARPMRLSAVPSVTVKATASSKARESLVTGSQEVNKENASGSMQPGSSRASSVGGAEISKRLSQLAMPRKRAQPQATANTTAVRAPSLSNSKRISSMVGPVTGPGSNKVISKEEAIHQKQRAKEIFGRDKIAKEELEREKREKEEAAKKARLQAAERGRQASREWAEKQKAKLAADKKEEVNGAAVALAAN